MQELPKGKKIILFDGLCNLCSTSVQFVIKHDKKDSYRFVALQSDLGKKIYTYLGIQNKDIESIIVYNPGKAYYKKSSAVFEIANDLNGLYFLVSIFKIIPTPISDYIYDYVAKNRYKWYGKKEVCMIPTAEITSKFLD